MDGSFLQNLSPDRRMALAYAPRQSRAHFAGFYALDARLAAIVLNTREPILAQLKLAWWREQLAKAPSARPSGEPVLAALACWAEHGKDLAVLADGWEWLLSEDPTQAEAIEGFASARGQACAVLARLNGDSGDEAARAGRNWGLADMAGLIGPAPMIVDTAETTDWSKPRLGRAMRPLLIHHEQARLSKNNAFKGAGLRGFVTSIRLGLLGI